MEKSEIDSEDGHISTDGNTAALGNMSRTIIFKNLFVISFTCILQFSAFNSFANVQSSLNKEEGLGTTGLALLYVVMVLTSLFIATITAERISSKWIMTWSMCTYVAYTATGFYPNWYTVLPASVIIGIGRY